MNEGYIESIEELKLFWVSVLLCSTMKTVFDLPECFLVEFLLQWVDELSFGLVDSVVCNVLHRPFLMSIIRRLEFITNRFPTYNVLMLIKHNSLLLTQERIKSTRVVKWRNILRLKWLVTRLSVKLKFLKVHCVEEATENVKQYDVTVSPFDLFDITDVEIHASSLDSMHIHHETDGRHFFEYCRNITTYNTAVAELIRSLASKTKKLKRFSLIGLNSSLTGCHCHANHEVGRELFLLIKHNPNLTEYRVSFAMAVSSSCLFSKLSIGWRNLEILKCHDVHWASDDDLPLVSHMISSKRHLREMEFVGMFGDPALYYKSNIGLMLDLGHSHGDSAQQDNLTAFFQALDLPNLKSITLRGVSHLSRSLLSCIGERNANLTDFNVVPTCRDKQVILGTLFTEESIQWFTQMYCSHSLNIRNCDTDEIWDELKATIVSLL
jgi:hypothetical protein